VCAQVVWDYVEPPFAVSARFAPRRGRILADPALILFDFSLAASQVMQLVDVALPWFLFDCKPCKEDGNLHQVWS
jgi:hypothetical protein